MALPITITSVTIIYAAQPLLASASAITSAVVALHLAQAEMIVWAKTSKRYAVPITPVPPLLESITIDLTMYGVLCKQAILANTLEKSPWPDRYKESMELLDGVANGAMPLLTGSNTVIAQGGTPNYVSGFSNKVNRFLPTFTELPSEYHEPDPDKLLALADERLDWPSKR